MSRSQPCQHPRLRTFTFITTGEVVKCCPDCNRGTQARRRLLSGGVFKKLTPLWAVASIERNAKKGSVAAQRRLDSLKRKDADDALVNRHFGTGSILIFAADSQT